MNYLFFVNIHFTYNFMFSVPKEDPKYHHQTELCDVSDADFKKSYEAPVFTLKVRIIQVILFIVGFGWLRLLLLIPIFIIYLIISAPFLLLYRSPIYVTLGNILIYITKFFIRIISFLLGVVYIKKNGKIDKKTRQFSYNHLSCLDGPLVYLFQTFTIVTHSGMKTVPIFNRILMIVDSIFVDRSKSSGTSQLFVECLNNEKNRPLALAPEGKISDGSLIYKFRTGGFLTDFQFQPVAIRYHNILGFAGVTLNWTTDTIFEFLWLALALPACVLEITFLPPFTEEEIKGKTPDEKATMAQLAIGNYLGVKAVNRSSKEIFQKKKDE